MILTDEIKNYVNGKLPQYIIEDKESEYGGSYCQFVKSKSIRYKPGNKTILLKSFIESEAGYNINENRITKKCGNKTCVNTEHFNIESIFEHKKRTFFDNCTKYGECMLWGQVDTCGYGRTYYKGDFFLAHRLSYQLFNNNDKKIPRHNEKGEELVIRHTCNKKRNCVNPKHLVIGGHLDNSKDREKFMLENTDKKTIDLITMIKNSKLEKDDKNYMTQQQRANFFYVKKSKIQSIDSGESHWYIPDKDGILEKLNKKIKHENVSENVEKKSKCHIYTGYVSKNNGYSMIKGKMVHLIVCEHKYGRKRKRNEVTRHLCNVRACVNPEHLVFGSSRENNIDSRNDGHKNHKLDLQKAEEIRTLFKSGEKTRKELGKEYGVSLPTIFNVLHNKSWVS